jgi:hypothetical protein
MKHQRAITDEVGNRSLVPRVGFEPTTIGLEVHCSIQLSYRGVSNYTGTEAELQTKRSCLSFGT